MLLRAKDRIRLLRARPNERSPKVRALLALDRGGSLREIAKATGLSHETVRNLAKDYEDLELTAVLSERRGRKTSPPNTKLQEAAAREHQQGMKVAAIARRHRRSEHTVEMILSARGYGGKTSAKALPALAEILDPRHRKTSYEIAATYGVRLSSIYRCALRVPDWQPPLMMSRLCDMVGLLIAPPLLTAAVCTISASASVAQAFARPDPLGTNWWDKPWTDFRTTIDEACKRRAPVSGRFGSAYRSWLTFLDRIERRTPVSSNVLVLSTGFDVGAWDGFARAWLGAHPRVRVYNPLPGISWSEHLVRALRAVSGQSFGALGDFPGSSVRTKHQKDGRHITSLEAYLRGAFEQPFWISNVPPLWVRMSISYMDWSVRRRWSCDSFSMDQGTLHLGRGMRWVLGHWPSPITNTASVDEYARGVAESESLLSHRGSKDWRIVVHDGEYARYNRWLVYDLPALGSPALRTPTVLKRIPFAQHWETALARARPSQRPPLSGR